ncbi:PqiC family protein [Neisseria chenwenguii]|uniref:Uncharacterized protein n=1 Tax=Neisseria chenwenguii TaxID=1853278 RepID=A0A220S553_9NEIS|nr:ABC-type transport auxiliary lipoprotein family protein [Neisseria chenwenguii]ASK28345.1 hypothetical protein BG910_11900 [Neisseria chenwenguii]ROV55429.1 hypothetical protein EGS38_09510 [Neisseria chenwenguii]
MRLFPTAAALALAACSSAPATQYFMLPDSQYSRPAAQGEEVAVKVFLAAPLDNGGLVYQTDALSINFAKNNLWASPLDAALANSFSNKLNRLNPRYVYAPAGRSQSGKTLKIYVEAFNGSYRGQTVVVGYAQWPNGQTRPFKAETAQQGDGYAAMVQSLEQGLQAAAEQIAR